MCCTCRLPERMEAMKEKLKMMYEVSGGKKVNIVSHSMGGLIVKCFLALYPEVTAEKSTSFFSMS